MSEKVSLTAQNRLIISGLLLSTAFIVFIAIFSIFNIQKMIKGSYQNFGEGISRTLAIESVELIKDLPPDKIKQTLDMHSDLLINGHNDIVLIEFRDIDGNLLSSTKNDKTGKLKPIITVSSPLKISKEGTDYGSVTVGLSGSVVSRIMTMARSSLLFVFTVVWLVFAFVILINTYLITRELKMLRDGVKKISTGQFGYKIEEREVSSEVQELFHAFNDMSNRLHLYEEQNIDRIMLERNKFESVLMSIANGVVVCDDNDNVVLINNHAKMLLEVTEEQLLNTKIQNYIDTSENYCFKAKIEEFKDTPLEIIERKPIEFNINVDNKVIKSIMSPMFTGSKKDYVGYIIVLIDMTKEAEMEKMRSDFISNVSHELRTPVTVLRSYIDTLYNYGNEFDYDTQKEFIGTINQEIIRLQSMVNDILDFSRMESNAPMEKSLNDITEVVEACVQQVSVLAQNRNLTISVHKDESIPEFMFNFNGIERALTNFLSNAIKYSPDNSVIDVCIKNLQETNEVEVTVTDKGCGIAPEHQKKIFDRFYRVENNVHSVKGTGLGLHLVKTTIEKYHNGRIFVNSKVDEGSTFGFILPAKVETDAEKVM